MCSNSVLKIPVQCECIISALHDVGSGRLFIEIVLYTRDCPSKTCLVTTMTNATIYACRVSYCFQSNAIEKWFLFVDTHLNPLVKFTLENLFEYSVVHYLLSMAFHYKVCLQLVLKLFFRTFL